MTPILEAIDTEVVKAVTASLAGVGIKGAGRLVELVRAHFSHSSATMPETDEQWREFLVQCERDEPELYRQLVAALLDMNALQPPEWHRPVFVPPNPFCDRGPLRDNLPEAGIFGFSGPAGTGKTALVRQLAVDHSGRYPLRASVDLDEFRLGDVLPLSKVRREILRQLGITDVATGDAELAAQYDVVLATRRLLMILDNAASGAEIEALVRPWPGALVLITTRDLTRDLRKCVRHWIPLPGLDVEGALDLLATRYPRPAIAAERSEVLTVLDRFGRSPHAIEVIGEILDWRAGERNPVATLNAEFEEMGIDELDALFDAVLSGQLAQVPDGLREQFCLLALSPAGEFTRETARILLGSDPRRVVDRLRELGLIEVIAGERYRMSWSVRRFAAGLGAPAGAAAAMRRLLTQYAERAVAADLAGDSPGNERMRYYLVPEGIRLFEGDRIEWLGVEAEVLGALVEYAYLHGYDDEVGQLCGALEVLSLHRGRYELCLAAFERGVLAARRQGASLLSARQYALCGRMATLLHHFGAARAALDAAREIAYSAGDPAVISSIEEFTGRLAEEQAAAAGVPDLRPAIDAFLRALEIDRRYENARRARGIHARMLANVLVKSGFAADAPPLLQEALDHTAEDRNRSRVYAVWSKCAVVLNDMPTAQQSLAQAQQLAAAAGSVQYRVELQDLAAEIDFRTGETERARSTWSALAEEFRIQGSPRASEFIAKLTWLPPAP